MTTAAVTGANGYVGGIIRKALASEMTVKSLVRVPRTHADLAWSFDTPVPVITEMLRDNNVSQVFHAAWDMQASSLAALQDVCVAGSQRLLEAARLAAVPGFTFISTISAFEDAKSAYGQAKLQVENMVLAAGGNVLRLGLVYGDGEGGMFCKLRNTVRGSRVIPMIGDGSAPQYLLHENTLVKAIQRARAPLPQIVTLANPAPVSFRDLLRLIAGQQGRSPILLPVPWQVFYVGLKAAEQLRFGLKFKSDSVLGFVFQNPAPDFSAMQNLDIAPEPLPEGPAGKERGY